MMNVTKLVLKTIQYEAIVFDNIRDYSLDGDIVSFRKDAEDGTIEFYRLNLNNIIYLKETWTGKM